GFHFSSGSISKGKPGRPRLQTQLLCPTAGGDQVMRRHIPGLHSGQHQPGSDLDGLFLVRVEKAFYRYHPQKPFLELRFIILEPKSFESRSFSGRLYCAERALWKFHWFLTDFGYDTELLGRDQV